MTDEWYLSRYEADYEAEEMPKGGVSILVPIETYEKIESGEIGSHGYKWGYDDGVFVSSTEEISDLLNRTGGDIDKINNELGVEWDTESLIELKLSDEQAEKLGIRLPSGEEMGANEDFIWGGKTSGGMNERVIDTFELSEAMQIEHSVTKSGAVEMEQEIEEEFDMGM